MVIFKNNISINILSSAFPAGWLQTISQDVPVLPCRAFSCILIIIHNISTAPFTLTPTDILSCDFQSSSNAVVAVIASRIHQGNICQEKKYILLDQLR